jgi:hypothetical protein
MIENPTNAKIRYELVLDFTSRTNGVTYAETH